MRPGLFAAAGMAATGLRFAPGETHEKNHQCEGDNAGRGVGLPIHDQNPMSRPP